MDKWSIIVLLLVIVSSILALFLRRDNVKEKERLEAGNLKAEDFQIIE